MAISPYTSRRLFTLLSIAVQNAPRLFNRSPKDETLNTLQRRAEEAHGGELIAFAILIPVLVLLSGLFAGLTLGYMSLDETQLHVLAISGTPKQQEYAKKIQPLRANGHLLLVTLLLANMIVNESLPVISDPVFHGGVQSVAISTVLIVIFSEIIPQSLFSRYGLYLGAKMAFFTQCLIYALWIISWPVAKILEFVLGGHHGIIYRRSELKELIALHSASATHGGDLKNDTVNIIGATLDLQEKEVSQAMTPIENVFMLSIDDKLDYNLLKKICEKGHSRVPVYEMVDVPAAMLDDRAKNVSTDGTAKAKKIMGILLIKNLVLLDPKAAVPLRDVPLNSVTFVPSNGLLLNVLDKFQQGHSHMAIVGKYSEERAATVKEVVKSSLTERIRARVGLDDSSSSESDSSSEDEATDGEGSHSNKSSDQKDGKKKRKWKLRHKKSKSSDLEKGEVDEKGKNSGSTVESNKGKSKQTQAKSSQIRPQGPADAVVDEENAERFLKSFDPAVMPLGIITLEDVLEELIGEEIYDEFDPEGGKAIYNTRAPTRRMRILTRGNSAPAAGENDNDNNNGNGKSPTAEADPPSFLSVSPMQSRSRSVDVVIRQRGPGGHAPSNTPTTPTKRSAGPGALPPSRGRFKSSPLMSGRPLPLHEQWVAEPVSMISPVHEAGEVLNPAAAAADGLADADSKDRHEPERSK